MRNIRRRSTLWVARLEVRPLWQCHRNIVGAFVSAMVPAQTAFEAEEAFGRPLEVFGFSIVRAEFTADFRRIESRYRRRKELRTMARRARRTGKPQIGTFHAW